MFTRDMDYAAGGVLVDVLMMKQQAKGSFYMEFGWGKNWVK